MVAGVTPSICCLASFEYVTKPRSRTSEDPGISLSVAATRPPVHDSAVASVNFFLVQISSRAFAAVMAASSGIQSFPRQAHGRGRVGDDAFTAAGKTELLAGGCLDRHAFDFDARKLGDVRAHAVAVFADAWRFAHDGKIEMSNAAAPCAHAPDREDEKPVG